MMTKLCFRKPAILGRTGLTVTASQDSLSQTELDLYRGREDIEKSSYHMLCLKLPKSIVQEEANA